jgi:antitoxin component of MazEF toxin-antitoxin module
MESFDTMTRKVGNSVGVLIPAEAVEREKITPGREVRVTIATKVPEDIRGRFKGLWSAKDLDEMVEEDKHAWGD